MQTQEQQVSITPSLLLAAALVGLGDTLYLSYYHLLGITPGCALKGCEIVLSSVYATPLGVPMAYLGVIFYLFMLFLGGMLVIDPTSKGLRLGVLAYTAIGLLCSICFETIQATIIHAICMYCAISAFATLALFAVAVWHLRATRVRA